MKRKFATPVRFIGFSRYPPVKFFTRFPHEHVSGSQSLDTGRVA